MEQHNINAFLKYENAILKLNLGDLHASEWLQANGPLFKSLHFN